ncbi:hypothetical protein KK104_17830, partial [Curtobacterium flaccumfaciens pv. betae]
MIVLGASLVPNRPRRSDVGQFVVVALRNPLRQFGDCVGVAVELGQDQRLGERRLPGRHGRG